jgi:hypothetical protein
LKVDRIETTVYLTYIITCEPSGGSIFLPILRVPSVYPVNFQNLPPVKKIKYKKILTYILRSIFLEIPEGTLKIGRKMLPPEGSHVMMYVK